MDEPVGFTPERRARFLALLEAGWTTERACAATPVSRTTVNRWAAKGRAPDADPEAAAFAQRLDQARAEAGQAIVAEREADRVPVFGDPDYIDSMTALEPVAMEALTPELRRRAGALFVAEHDDEASRARMRPWISDEKWARHRAAWLRGEVPVLPPEPRSSPGRRDRDGL